MNDAGSVREAGGAGWGVGVLLTLVLYVLSIGPTIWLYENTTLVGSVPEEVWMVFYAPLGWFMQISPHAESMMNSWIELWV